MSTLGDDRFYEIHGKTQGTTYTIILEDENKSISKTEIDSIFTAFDMSLSTYVKNSVITQMNDSEREISLLDKTHFFQNCYNESQHIFQLTKGDFDPSVFPLVQGWGFMTHVDTPLSQIEIDSILEYIDFKSERHHSIKFNKDSIYFTKNNPKFKIDFNAIAQGQSVDVVDQYLKENGISNCYIEIGGELIVRGVNREGQDWRIGIDSPEENLKNREIENVLSISNCAVATSGNYRKFYVKDGVKYSHTLNPKTGYPVQHSLLSATVIAKSCLKADGYATAFMVMGKDKALEFVENHPEEALEIYLLFADENGEIQRVMSQDFSKYLAN